MRFQIDWASLIVGSKFTVFALFYFVFEGSRGGLYLEGRFNGGFFALPLGGCIFGGAYTRRGVFSEFYSTCRKAAPTDRNGARRHYYWSLVVKLSD